MSPNMFKNEVLMEDTNANMNIRSKKYHFYCKRQFWFISFEKVASVIESSPALNVHTDSTSAQNVSACVCRLLHETNVQPETAKKEN